MRRQTRRVVWRETGRDEGEHHQAQRHEALLRCVDVETREGAEWLTGQTEHGEYCRIRLDRIESWG